MFTLIFVISRNNAVTAEDKVLFTLRFYATGNWLLTCGDFIGIHKSTGSRIVTLVSHWIATMGNKFINFPYTDAEKKAVAQEFFAKAKFPRCIGAIDCTHVKIQSPGGDDAESFRNRKGFFSLNVQTVSDANGRIQNIVARWPGSAHDSTIFNNSRLKAQFENGDFNNFVLVGDSGYAVSSYLLTPLRNPQNAGEDLYNEAQIRTRNAVERSYGIWKRRFPILSMGIRVDLSKVESIIVATAVLHNIATFFSVAEPRAANEELEAIAATMLEAEPLLEPQGNGNDHYHNPREVTRSKYVRYFRSLV